MEEEAIYYLTLMQISNYEKLKGKYIKLTYEELLNFTIKTLKLIERCRDERIRTEDIARFGDK